MWCTARQWDPTIAEAADALKQNPACVRALIVRSAALAGKRAYEAARIDAEAAIRMAPADPWAYVALGDAWRAKGYLERAIAQYDLAVQHDATNCHLLLRRMEARAATSHQDQWRQALAEAMQVTRLSADDPACMRSCQLARAEALVKQGDFDHAQVEYDELLARNPKDVEVLIAKGLAYGQAKDYQRALGEIDEAIHLEPKNPRAYIARADVRCRQLNVRARSAMPTRR